MYSTNSTVRIMHRELNKATGDSTKPKSFGSLCFLLYFCKKVVIK